MNKAQIYFTKVSKFLAIALLLLPLLLLVLSEKSWAAAGINKTVNFQGKVVNKTTGVNVTNGTYPMTFIIYDKPSGGTALWTEDDSSVTVTDGIFRVALGSTTAFPAGMNWNQDGLFLDITFDSEQMGSRVQLTAVPYAFNSQTVAGLTVQDDSGNGSTSGTLQVANGKTIKFSNSLNFSGTDGKSLVLTNGLTVNGGNDGTLAFGGASKTFTINNTLTLSGTDGSTLNIGGGGTLGSNAYTSTAYAPLASPTFTGTVVIPSPFTLGATSVTSTGTQLNYLSSATGTTGTTNTNLVFSASPTLTGTVTLTGTTITGTPTWSSNQAITLSTAAQTNITSLGTLSGLTMGGTLAMGSNSLTSSGTIGTAATTNFTGLNLTITGALSANGSNGTGSECLLGGSTASWGACGGGGGTSPFTELSGAIVPLNSTEDFLIGGQATTSAKFAVTGINGTGIATASVSGNFIAMPRNGAGGALGIGTTTPIGKFNIESPTFLSNLSLVNNGTTGAPPTIPNSFLSTLTVANGETVGSRPLFFGYVNGGNWDGFVTTGACGAFTSMCFDMGTGSTVNTALKSISTTLFVGGATGAANSGDGNYTDVIFGNTGNIGIGTASPISQLHVTRALALGATGKALAIFDQIENQDIFTASKGGTTKFVIDQSGNIGIGGAASSSNYINSTNFKVSTGGAITAATGITSSGNITLSGLTANRFVTSGTGGLLGTSATLANLVSSLSDISGSTGTTNLVLSASPTFTGTITAAAITTDSVTFSGSQTWAVAQGSPCSPSSRLCFTVGGTSEVAYGNGGGLFLRSTLSQNTTPDIAENINIIDTSIDAGDIVSSSTSDPTKGNIYDRAIASKTTSAYSSDMIGVISSDPGIILHSKAIDTDHTSEANERPLTIGGRVPVKVSSINGDIKAGDSITSSDIPGVGMKATKAGRVVGIALEDYSNSDTNHVEKILLFVNSSWYDPDVLLATDGNLTITPTADSSFKVQNADKDVNRIGAFATLIVGKIRAGVINAQQISVNSIVIATDNVTIGGQRLSDYIDSIVDQKLAQNSQSVTSNAGLNYLNNLSTIDTAKSITLSEINADRIIVGLEINTPKAVVHQVSLDEISSASGSGILVNGDVIFTGTITADKIRANQIEGLEILTNKISSLDSKIATIGANLIPAPVSTESSLLEKQSALIDKITKDLASASASATVPSGSLTSGVLDSSGLTIINGGIRVKGNGLFEGILTVLDTLTTNNFIVNGASTFFSDVLFKGKVNFDKNPTFASDTGGFAAITKGTDRVEVKFDTEFENDPFINAQVSFDEQKDAKGNVIDTADLEQAFFSQGYKYIILNRSKTGFTIVLNKKAGDKVNFTWTAIQVKDAKTIQSRLPD